VEYDELPQPHDWMKVTGSRIGVERVYVAERLYRDEDFIRKQNANGTYSYTMRPGVPVLMMGGVDTQYVGPGDIKYKDLNHDGAIDMNDMTRYVGHPYNPEINYGFGLNLEFKGFYASVFFQGVANTSVLLASGNNNFWPFNWGIEKSNYRVAFLDRWTAADPREDVFMPRLHVGYGQNVNKESNTWWLKDASFIRLKNLELGYSIPADVSRKVGIGSARVYLMGYNLHVWDHIKQWDPEQGKRNNGNSYPLARTLTLGLDINF
jgi:hypothetical protein